MIPRTVRLNASVTNQTMRKHSLETLATISNFRYFGHIKQKSDSMKKRYDVMTDSWQWKIRKTVHKMISRNMRNCEDELVQHLNCHTKQNAIEGPELYEGVSKGFETSFIDSQPMAVHE